MADNNNNEDYILTIENLRRIYKDDDGADVEALEDVIDDMVTVMKNNHAARLKEGLCTVERGVTFIEMLTDIERISDHCENVCQHLRQRINGQELSTHTVPGDDESRATERDMYDQFRRSYEAAYLTPIS